MVQQHIQVGGLHVARGGTGYGNYKQSAGTTCAAIDSPGGPLVPLWTVWGHQLKYDRHTTFEAKLQI